jgi:hypothetical protein
MPGVVSVGTVAGDGTDAILDGLGTAAQIKVPGPIDIDGVIAFGDVYCVRRVTVDTTVTTVFGSTGRRSSTR